MATDLVLVTGGSGFLASHCIVQLLDAGYAVRTTVRSPARGEELRAAVRQGGVPDGQATDRLQIVEADLSREEGWARAAQGARFVLHVASPFPLQQPKDAEELIRPAREGTLRVLRAARQSGAERVVMTSSWVAIGYGHPPQREPFDESAWTNLHAPGLTPYMQSKTLAERAAWEFVGSEGGGLELAVVNPGGIFGPALGPQLAASLALTQRFLDGKVPACPRISFPPVDVRDVARLHLLAMTRAEAAGERFLAVNDEMISPAQMAAEIGQHFPELAKRLPKRELPDWLVRVLAIFEGELRPLLPELGQVRRATNKKAREVLGWSPRSNGEMVAATVESLLRFRPEAS